MAAMVASHDLNADNNWYLDSGATHHLTNNFDNLSTGFKYGRGNQVYAANDSCLSILHYGSSIFPSFNLDKKFVLKNLFHVPSTTKNLISVS